MPGFSVIREYSGHGIGRRMHEPPNVLNYGVPGQGVKLEEGMVIAIEPMAVSGSPARAHHIGWVGSRHVRRKARSALRANHSHHQGWPVCPDQINVRKKIWNCRFV